MECPCTVVVPSVVDYEILRSHVVAVPEAALPVCHYVEHAVGSHISILSARSRVVAVDVELIPADVAWVSTPRHCTLALRVSQERTTLLCLAYVL